VRGEKRRVLVTGATSTLGRSLCQDLYYDRENIDCVLAVADAEKPYYFRDYHRERFAFRPVNIQRPRQLKNLFLSTVYRDARIDTVVHLGFSPDKASHHESLVVGLEAMLERSIEAGVRRFLFRSSVLVYRLRPWLSSMIDEDSELNFDPRVSAWAKARVDADMVCRAAMGQSEMHVAVLRPSCIIGRNIRSYLMDLFDSSIIFRPIGYDPMMRPIHSSDVIQAFRNACLRDIRGVFNIAGPDIGPLSEFCRLSGRPTVLLPTPVALRMTKLAGVFGLTRFDASVDFDVLKYSCVLDTSKAEEKFAFEPRSHIKFG
jgi:UDP-glucose 4-epimerase